MKDTIEKIREKISRLEKLYTDVEKTVDGTSEDWYISGQLDSLRFALSLLTKEEKKEFKVFSYSTWEGKSEWKHWSEDLTMYIKKDGKEIKLEGEELQEVVKALPRTFGGQY